MSRFLPDTPERLFLILASLFGLILCFLVPPLGGGNEIYNFQRVAAIAYGHPLIEKAEVPAGIVEFTHVGESFLHEGLQPPFSYSAAEYRKMAAIKLSPEKNVTLLPNPINGHHPFCYLPQVIGFKLGAGFALPPLLLLYIARICGLAASIALTFYAIRIMPSHRYMLCALALLPPITFSRSCIDADPVTNGMAFLFIACALRAISRSGGLRARELVTLAMLAFVMAQCKNIYLFLPWMVLAIPRERFASVLSRLCSIGLIVLPGLIASIGWLVLLKTNPDLNMPYHTWGGEVNSKLQMLYVQHHPMAFAAIFLRTLFMTPFFLKVVLGLLGVFGPPVSIPTIAYPAIIALLCAVIVSDKTAADVTYGKWLKFLAFAIILSFLGVSLTALYMQWTGVGAPVIEGFNGRYFYPVLPLFLIYLKPLDKPLFRQAAPLVILFASFGCFVMLARAVYVYYG